MRTLRILIGALLLAACTKTETPQQAEARITAESATARRQIEPLIANYERWVAGGHADSAATIITEDFRALPPNQPAITGRAAWLAWASPMLGQGKWTEHIITESLVANGPLAIERGRYTLQIVPGPSAARGTVAVNDTGKYLWHWHKVDGRWLLAEAAWNSDLPVKTR